MAAGPWGRLRVIRRAVLEDQLGDAADRTRTFYPPSADYIWPQVMNRKVHEVASANGGRIITTYWDENLVSALPPEHIEGLYGCIDYGQSSSARRGCWRCGKR